MKEIMKNIYFGLKSELIHKSHKGKSSHYKTLLDIMEKRKKKDSVNKTDRNLTKTNNRETFNDFNSNLNYDIARLLTKFFSHLNVL